METVIAARWKGPDSVAARGRPGLKAAEKYSLVANSIKSEIAIESTIQTLP